jgi:hypothetical protein
MPLFIFGIVTARYLKESIRFETSPSSVGLTSDRVPVEIFHPNHPQTPSFWGLAGIWPHFVR